MEERIVCPKCGMTENTSRYRSLCLCGNCNEMWEENKMDMDFQVGDKIEHLLTLRTGKIIDKTKHQVIIEIDGDRLRSHCDHSGRVSETDTVPVFYHLGSIKREGPRIIIDPVKPKRDKWWQIYIREDGTPFFGWLVFNTETEANKNLVEGFIFFKAIQLKKSMP